MSLVKATVPALREHGETITRTFYSNMFAEHPELYNIFNPANQANGGQPRSLAAAVLAYAERIDNPGVLGGMLERIEGKHVSLEIKPEHYPIVGTNLLGAIKQVLGDAATPEILDAWGAAYGKLAEIMIGGEKALYDASAALPAGWRGFKPFRVERRVAESDYMMSFYLVPQDGEHVAAVQAGAVHLVEAAPGGLWLRPDPAVQSVVGFKRQVLPHQRAARTDSRGCGRYPPGPHLELPSGRDP